MKKQLRLQKTYQFQYIYKKGKSKSDNLFVVIVCTNTNHKPKYGFSVSKKFGKATKRNKVKRQMKEIFEKMIYSFKKNFNVVVLPREACQSATFEQMTISLRRLACLHNLFDENLTKVEKSEIDEKGLA